MPHLAHFTWLTIGSPQRPIFLKPYSYARRSPEVPHDHEFIELVLVHSGHALHESEGGIAPIGVGSVIVIHPGAWHNYRDCQNFKVYNCCFVPELLRHELAWLIEDPILGPVLWNNRTGGAPRVYMLQLQQRTTRRCSNLAAELSSLVHGSPSVSRAEAAARLAVYFTALSASFSKRVGNLEAATKATHPAVMNCMKQIEADIAHEWTVKDLARANCICREYLIRLFNQKTGLSPKAYLDKRRSERAAHLLEKTTLPVCEIGLKVGWSSPITFSRRFKAYYGMSATAYRDRFLSANSDAIAIRASHGTRS